MQFIESDLWPLLGVPVSILLARLVDVTLGTFRIAVVARGRRGSAPFIGFLEILTWLIALGLVVQNLDKPINYLAYAGGFSTGTWLGLLVDERLGPGLVSDVRLAKEGYLGMSGQRYALVQGLRGKK